ncbi:hypothetical protein GCM10011490_26280 [Pseudoclavibacter endophyticus]|nr:hypothetical protein GCM10011490_26280 [Pseudoclavibacter endophyticus]
MVDVPDGEALSAEISGFANRDRRTRGRVHRRLRGGGRFRAGRAPREGGNGQQGEPEDRRTAIGKGHAGIEPAPF